MSDTFRTIVTFQYSSEAQIVKGRLEAEGIPVFMTDNHTIDTDPLVSSAIGGVKLKIYAEDAERTSEVLKSIAEHSLDDEGQPLHCPNCNGTRIDLMTNIKDFKSFMAFIAQLIIWCFSVLSKT